MDELQQNAEVLMRADPAVANVGSSLGTTASVNRASLCSSALSRWRNAAGSPRSPRGQPIAAENRRYAGLRFYFVPCRTWGSAVASPRRVPGRAGRDSAAGHAAKAGTNTSGAGGLYPNDACGLIVVVPSVLDDDLSSPQRIGHLRVQVRCASAHSSSGPGSIKFRNPMRQKPLSRIA